MSNAQFALGDVAFSAYNADNTGGGVADAFTIVLLKSVTSGEQLGFTENGWFQVGGFRTGESSFVLEFTTNLGAGSQVVISSTPFTARDETGASVGTLTGSGLLLASGGDQIFIYDPANVPVMGDESGFIAAIHMNGSWDSDSTSSTTSAKPSVFTDGVNSISISPEVDNARVAAGNCSTFTDVPTLRTLLNTASNWETHNDTPYDQDPPICDFKGTLGLGDVNLERAVSIYPNPATTELHVETTSGITISEIQVYNITGKQVMHLNNVSNGTLDISALTSGIYLIKMQVDDQVVIKKLVKN